MADSKSERTAPFTTEKVESVVKEQLTQTGLTTGIVDRCVSELLSGANIEHWSQNKLVSLTIAAVLDVLSDELARQAAIYVNGARASHGATWRDVCLVTKYTEPGSAARRYDESQHRKELTRVRSRARSLNEKRK